MPRDHTEDRLSIQPIYDGKRPAQELIVGTEVFAEIENVLKLLLFVRRGTVVDLYYVLIVRRKKDGALATPVNRFVVNR